MDSSVKPICKVTADGSQLWTLPYSVTAGKLVWHRLDGPAIVSANGGKQWWVNNKRHRLYGPAIETPNGHNTYWLYGNIVGLGMEVQEWLIENYVDLDTDEGKMAFKLRWL